MSSEDEDEIPAHSRHFTLAEAEAELGRLRPLLQRLREAKQELADEETHQLLVDAAPTNGGGEPGRQVGEAFLEVRRLLLALGEIGVVLRDIDSGLIDFPSFREGREVYLCWSLEEDSITSWHEIDQGFQGRRPLD